MRDSALPALFLPSPRFLLAWAKCEYIAPVYFYWQNKILTGVFSCFWIGIGILNSELINYFRLTPSGSWHLKKEREGASSCSRTRQWSAHPALWVSLRASVCLCSLKLILHQRERGSNPFNQFDHFTAGSALCTRTTLKRREVGRLIRTTIACVNASRSIQQVTARIGKSQTQIPHAWHFTARATSPWRCAFCCKDRSCEGSRSSSPPPSNSRSVSI